MADGRTFRDASAAVRLDGGRLSIEDLTARVAGGVVSGDAELDPRAAAAAELTVRLNVHDVSVADLIAGDRPGYLEGRIDLDLNIDATGRTIDGLLGDLDGQVAVFSGNGRLENVPLNRMIPDLDIARILPFVGGGRSTVRVNCLVGEFDIADGVARADAMLDTERMTLLGEGTIDLDRQTLDLSLQPLAKTRKLSTAEVPVDVTGSLSEPDISPRKGAVVGGLMRGVVGGLLFPLNQLTTLLGPAVTDACGAALRQARERARDVPGPN